MKRFYYICGVALLLLSFQSEGFSKGEDVIIKEITGFVQIQRLNESDWIKAEDDATLTSGDKVRSFLKSSALLIFPEGSEFRLRENTSLDIKDISQNMKENTAKRELKCQENKIYLFFKFYITCLFVTVLALFKYPKIKDIRFS